MLLKYVRDKRQRDSGAFFYGYIGLAIERARG